jgi:hypothetical protein
MKCDWIRINLIAIFVLLLAACSKVGAPIILDTPLQPATPQSIDMSPESQMNDTQMTHPSQSSEIELQIEKAKEDLAQRLSIAVTEISLLEAKEATWPDTSLGCSESGVQYSQALTSGYLIKFEVNDTTYEYHTDMGEQIILCENPEFPIIPVKPGEIDDGEPWMPN